LSFTYPSIFSDLDTNYEPKFQVYTTARRYFYQQNQNLSTNQVCDLRLFTIGWMNWIGQIGWCLVIVPCSKLDSKLRGKSGKSGEPYILLYKYIIYTETTKQGRDFLKTDEDVRCTIGSYSKRRARLCIL
jgi:hypothetical protein